MRKIFVEDIDYSNTDPTIDWSKFDDPNTGDVATLATFTVPSASLEWGQLSDLQRDSVLIKLDYRKLYNVSFANLQTNRTINGIPTVNPWHPSWESSFTTTTLDTSYEFSGGQDANGPITYKQYSNTTIQRVPVVGWRDKYVQLPTGAADDLLRVVSQGTPKTIQEDVGEYYDQARVLYTQDKSAQLPRTVSLDVRETDFDNSPIRWDVSYFDSGLRWYSINPNSGPHST